MPTRMGWREIIVFATLGAVLPLAQAHGQGGVIDLSTPVRDIEVGTYACATSHMAGIQHQQKGDIPTAGAATPRPEQAKFFVTIRRYAELSPEEKSQHQLWGIFQRLNIGANTFAATFSAGFVYPSDKVGSIMLGHLLPRTWEPDNAKRAPNQYYGAHTDVFSIIHDRSFTAYSGGTYAVGQGGVFILYGKCVQTQ